MTECLFTEFTSGLCRKPAVLLNFMGRVKSCGGVALTRKRSLRATVLSVALLFIVVVLPITYIHEKYFFNPLTFKEHAFLYQPWNAYKKPLWMEIFNDAGTSPAKKVTDPKQVRHVMSEIEKTSNEWVSSPRKFSGPMYGIFLHTGDVLFQQVHIYPSLKILQFVTQQGFKYAPLSPGLLSYVEEQLGISQ